MSDTANRRITIALCILLCLGAMYHLVMSSLVFESRRTFMRPVYFAVEQHKDPYQAALAGMEEYAVPQMTLNRWFAISVIVCGVAVIVLTTLRRPEVRSELSSKASRL